MPAMLQTFPYVVVAIVSGDDPVAQAQPVTIPVELKAMLDAAIASGNEGEVDTIVKYANAARVPAAPAMQRIAQAWKNDRYATAQKRLREADFLALVKGRIEVSAFQTSGNSDNIGVSGRVNVQREGLKWRHKLALQADYQESFQIVSRERYLAAYEPNYKVSDRLYFYGAAQYESDRFLGYTSRYSASLGAGYMAIRRTGMTLELELGPAFRRTDFIDDTLENNVAARGSVDFDWQVSPRLTLRQDASAYLQSANSTVSSTTALSAKVLGPLQMQLSYVVQYESTPPQGRGTTDRTSRASLVYAF
jgi:putative salt-induced outer membrane protein